MSFQCEFCSKCFSSKSSLNTHKSKTKYCLEIQKNKGFISEVKGKELCKYCSREFFKKDNKQTHETTCKHRISTIQNQDITIMNLTSDLKLANEKIEFYKKLLEEKDSLILKLSSEKSVINNTSTSTNCNNQSTSSSSSTKQNIIMGSLDLSVEKIKMAVENYTIDHYNRTSEGLVDWCVNNLLKDENNNLRYICNDKNRRSFQFKSEAGDIVTDPNADKLKLAIKPILNDKLRTHKKLNYSKMAEESDDEDSEKSDVYIKIHEENKTMGVEFEKELAKKTYTK